MTQMHPTLDDEEQVELHRLCEEYTTATGAVRKAFRVGNPPEPGRVQLLLQAEAHAAAIVERIKQLLGVAAN